jgi:hypothetical protein
MSLFNAVTVIGLTAIVALCCAFVFAKGGPGEKYGAAIYGVPWVAISAYEFLSGQAAPAVPMLVADFAIAVGFLVLAVRFNNLYLGAAMILQGIAFALHVSRLTEATEPRVFGLHFYVLGMNVVSVLILFVMLGATLNTMHRRKHPKGDEDDEHMWEPAPKA